MGSMLLMTEAGWEPLALILLDSTLTPHPATALQNVAVDFQFLGSIYAVEYSNDC
jgi:hypothetical protein